MQFEIDQRIAAPRDAVERAFVDPSFLAALEALPTVGAPHLLDQQREGARVRQRVRYRFTGELSGAARRVVDPARLTWVEDSVFDGEAHRTDVRILPDHYGSLLECRMTIRFDDVAGGTRRVAHGEMKVHVPVVGAKVERAIVSGLEEHAARQVPVLLTWLRDAGTFAG